MDQPHIDPSRAFGIAPELIRLHDPPEIFLVLPFPALSVIFCGNTRSGTRRPGCIAA